LPRRRPSKPRLPASRLPPGELFSPASDEGSLLRFDNWDDVPNSPADSSLAAAARLRLDELLLSIEVRPMVPSMDLRCPDEEETALSCVEAVDSLRGVEVDEEGVEGSGGRGLDDTDAFLLRVVDEDRRKNGIELGVRRLLEDPGVWRAESDAEGGASDEAALGLRSVGSGGGGEGIT
jgi:hypothetical protein